MLSTGYSKVRGKGGTVAWEQFCKDEARRTAHEFLEKVRRLQTTDRDSMEVPESVFATKFSAHFMDEVMDLTGVQQQNGGLNNSTDFSRNNSGVGGKKAGPAKTSWWNIFKRRQDRGGGGGGGGGVLAGSSAANRNAQQLQLLQNGSSSSSVVVQEALVKMLDMNNSSLELSWQACRLALTSEQGNHQLEIYCPPKSNFPKMSLFCFLLKEVRSSTTLELPDSMSSFVIKSDNHVEYVFDAGSEKEKDKWISTIRSHSSKLCHQNSAPANGHITKTTRSHSMGGMEHTRIHKKHHAVVAFPVLARSDDPGTPPPNHNRDTPSPAFSSSIAGRRPTRKSFSASPSPCPSESLRRLNHTSGSCSSPTPDVENTPTFFRCRPQRNSPNPRPRRTLSMYEHGTTTTSAAYPIHLQLHSQTPPSPSPPLPKRSQRSISSLNELPTTPTSARTFSAVGIRNGWSNGSNPAIMASSSSHRASVSNDSPFSSNLGNSDKNSSSSALHPVTLNATNVPQTQKPRSGRHSSVSSLNTSPSSLPRQLSTGSTRTNSHFSPPVMRKMSSTASASPSGSSNWTADIEDEVRRAKQRFPSCDILSGAVGTPPGGHTIFPALDCSSLTEAGGRKKHDGSPSPPLNPFPNLPSPAPSPSVLRRFSPTLDSYMEETDGGAGGGGGGGRDSEIIEVFPSQDQDTAASRESHSPIPPPIPAPSRPRNMRFFSDTHVDEITHEPHTLPTTTSSPSPSTPSPSSSENKPTTTTSVANSQPSPPSPPQEEHNGIFIEFHNMPRVPHGLPSNVSHPYTSWAVTTQDADNLRQLVQFPWFHGMISRANATQLVLADGESGSGRYLVRQSESREGEFVLTFNYKGRAKHLRIVLDSTGCSVQHLFFNTVSSMLEYFKTNTIPLETCWSEDDCKITDFIDRSASDSLRTITAIYNSELLSSPRMPRRSHSLQIALTQAVASVMQHQHGGAQTPGSSGGGSSERSGRIRRGSSSLPHNAHHHTGGGGATGSTAAAGGGWRSIFSGRASTLQRRHSEMADMHHAIDNNYTYRY